MKKYLIPSVILLGLAGFVYALPPTSSCTLSVNPVTTPLGANNNLTVTWTTNGNSNVVITGNDGNSQNVSMTTLVKNGSSTFTFVGALTTRFHLQAGTASCDAVVYGTSNHQPN